MVSRCVAGGPVHFPDWMNWQNNRNYQSIKGNGLQGGGQGASGMSALGGTIRQGELVDEKPIRHAIKINPWAEKYCHYSETVPGYKWPAISADNYASSGYNPDADPDIVMGSLFAIPPLVTEESLNLQTAPGKKLFFTLQNYGAYFTEDAYWDVWDLIVERDVELEFENVYGFSMESSAWQNDVNNLIQALHVITNNTPETVGGGGTPLQPLAPEFGGPGTGVSRHYHSVTKTIPAGNQELLSVRYFSIAGRSIQRPRLQANSSSVIFMSNAGGKAGIAPYIA